MKTLYRTERARLLSLAILFMVAFFSLAPLCFGQQTQYSAQQFNVVPQNAAPQAANVAAISDWENGATPYYYFVITHLNGQISAPVMAFDLKGPASLSSSVGSRIHISWTETLGATYDVLESASPTLTPASNCGCAVVTGLSSNHVLDVGSYSTYATNALPGFPWELTNTLVAGVPTLSFIYNGETPCTLTPNATGCGTPSGSGASAGVISLSANCGGAIGCFPIQPSGFYSCLANYSSTSTTLATDTTVDAPFTTSNPNMAGWQVFVSSKPCSGTNGAVNGAIQFEGTISAVIDAHHVTLSGTPSGTCAGNRGSGQSCRAYFFPGDSGAQIQTAFTAATNFTGTCLPLVMPGGIYKTNQPILSVGNCGPSISGLATIGNFQGMSVTGQSEAGTVLVVDPTMDASSCDPGCIFALSGGAVQATEIQNMTISGGGNPTVTNGNNKCGVAGIGGFPSTIQNVLIDGWGFNTSVFTGLCWAGAVQGQSLVQNVSVYDGGYACSTLHGFTTIVSLMCFTPTGSTLEGGGNYSFGSQFNGGNAGGFTITTPGTCSLASNLNLWVSVGDQFTGSVNNGVLNDGDACPIIFVGDYVNCSAHVVVNSCVQIGNSGTGHPATLIAQSTNFTSAGTNRGGTEPGSQFIDLCGNTYNGTDSLTDVTINGPCGSGAKALQVFATTILSGNVSVTAGTLTPITTVSLTMPSSGCPCRVLASYNLFLSSSNVITDTYVTDGTNIFATNENESSAGFHTSQQNSAWSPVTYANSATVTLTLDMQIAGSNNGTVEFAPNAVGGDSFIQAAAFASN